MSKKPLITPKQKRPATLPLRDYSLLEQSNKAKRLNQISARKTLNTTFRPQGLSGKMSTPTRSNFTANDLKQMMESDDFGQFCSLQNPGQSADELFKSYLNYIRMSEDRDEQMEGSEEQDNRKRHRSDTIHSPKNPAPATPVSSGGRDPRENERMSQTFFWKGFGTGESGKADTIDIKQIKKDYRTKFDKLTTDDMEVMIVAGKKLQEVIKEQRANGKSYVSFSGFMLNINANSSVIGSRDLTRARFCAALHASYQENIDANRKTTPEKEYKVSPLIHRMVLDENNPLNPTRYLLGTGYHYNWRQYTKSNVLTEDDYPELRPFVLGCFLLDFFSAKSPNSEFRDQVTDIKTLVDYIKLDISSKGNTILAAGRNIGVKAFDTMMTHESFDIILESAQLIDIDWNASTSKQEVESSINRARATWTAKLIRACL